MSAAFRPAPQRSAPALRAVLAALACVAVLGGCAPRGAPGPNDTAAQASAILERPRAPGEDNGLEVLRWSVADDETAIRRALSTSPAGVVSDADRTNLARFGLRAAVLSSDALAQLLVDLGGTSAAIATWHGQMPEWRELAFVRLEEPQVFLIGSRPERLAPGWLRLAMRGWTVPLEDGATFELQVAPQWLPAQAPGQPSGPAARERDRPRSVSWPDSTLRLELPPNAVLVLVSAPPLSAAQIAASVAEADPEGPPQPLAMGSTGPPAELPSTIGEAILTDGMARPPRRTVLVLRPWLPAILFPPPAPDPLPSAPPPAAEPDQPTTP